MSGPARDIRFEPLTRADGIPPDSFHRVAHDQRGFLWFATRNGLVRYDGYEHVRYPGLPQIRKTTAEAEPGLLHQDRKGNLWIGANVLTRFDPATGSFVEVLKPQTGTEGNEVEAITSIEDGPNGTLWLAVWSARRVDGILHVSSEPVLYQVDPERRTSVPHRLGPEITNGKHVSIRSILTGPQEELWLGTSVGLVRFDPRTGAFRHYPHTHPDAAMQGLQRSFNWLAWDKSGHLWVHMPAGIERFDPGTGTFDRFIESRFYEMTPDPAGRLWLWGGQPGLVVFDPSSPPETALRSVSFMGAPGQPTQTAQVEGLGTDRQGNMWASPQVGSPVQRYSPFQAKFGSYLPDPSDARSLSGGMITGFAEDADGSIWISSEYAGLNRFDPRSSTFTRFRHVPGRPDSPPDEITQIYVDRSGVLWIGAQDGTLGRFDRKTGRYRRLTKLAYRVTSMLEDSAGRFWVGAQLTPVQLVDRKTGAVTPMSIRGGYLTYEDRAGNIWFGFAPGFNKLDRQGDVRVVPIGEPASRNEAALLPVSMHEDAEGILWVATVRGLYAFDPRTEKAAFYGTDQGLPTNYTACLLPDRNENLWIANKEGISRFDLREKRFYNYDERDGLQGRSFNMACFAARDGTLYFGGSAGFNAFHPRDILSRSPEPPVVLTRLQVNGKDLAFLNLDSPRLSHRRNNVTFEFAAPNSLNPGRIRYRFKLEGFEERWTESSRRQARYTDLGPGDYVFRAEASVDGRSWSGRAATFKLTILPPWWRTWWAEALGAMAVLGLLFAAHKLRVAALHRRQRALAAIVSRRTAELVEARDQAQAASRAKSVFLANMSHELRTPLNAILGFAQLLHDRPVSEDPRKELSIIRRSGEHLLHVIDEVLDVAKAEAGRQELQVAPCDISQLAQEVLEMVRTRAWDKGLDLLLVEALDFPRYARVDAPGIRQMLINLLGNAVRYTERGSVTLRTSANPGPDARHSRLIFEVEDTGIGIAPEDQERIFEAFVQVGKRTVRKGTGLGLTITRQFVTMAGGTIAVHSVPGEGSRFRVEIPVELVDAEDLAAAGEPDVEGLTLEPGQPEYRVLGVDDEPDNLTLLEQVLRAAGFQVRSASDGAQAVTAFENWRPHFIWMDLRMPEVDGLEATRRIRAMPGGADVKIAALTASASGADRDQVMSSGFDDYVPKPFRNSQVLECMARHLGVRYLTASAKPTPVPARASTASLGALPAELRAQLRRALIALDASTVRKAIERIGEHDAALSATLLQMADRFAYTAILNALGSEEWQTASAGTEKTV